MSRCGSLKLDGWIALLRKQQLRVLHAGQSVVVLQDSAVVPDKMQAGGSFASWGEQHACALLI